MVSARAKRAIKRGQSASNAAVVVILIAILIILYILFLPPEDRATLLGESPSSSNLGSGANAKTVLFTKTPGRLYPAGSGIVEHKFPSFLVFTSVNAGEIKRTDSLYTRSTAFSSNKAEMVFYYDELTMNDLKLSFNVQKQSGRLKIWINDKVLFEGELDKGSPLPINIPRESLVEKNTLTFEVTSPGLVFWRTNEYELESVVVSGKLTDYSGAISEQHFSISDTEYEKMEKAVLEFLPDCPPRDTGQLQILLNGRPIYSSFPDCGIKATIEVSKEFLKVGDNALVATTNSGSFLVDAPKLTAFMKDATQPVFYFSAPPNLIDAVVAGKRGVLLTLRFADSTSVKRGVIEVNGFKTSFETQDYIFQTPLDPQSVFDGSNGIRIVPLSGPIDVVELRVDVI